MSSSWRRVPWDSRPEFFFKCNSSGHNPYITSSLTRGWVCHLLLQLALASTFIFESEPHGTRDHILQSQIRYFPFCRLLRLAGLRWRYSTPPPHHVFWLWLLKTPLHGRHRKHRLLLPRMHVYCSLPGNGYPPIVACACVEGMCLPTCCLAMGIHVTTCISKRRIFSLKTISTAEKCWI
jgi:hypothetical protein